jgi:hypothetical protein
MPDVKVATAPTVGVRFIVDIVAAKAAGENISAGLVVAQTFPAEEFRPRIKEGEDANALLNIIGILLCFVCTNSCRLRPVTRFVRASLTISAIRS